MSSSGAPRRSPTERNGVLTVASPATTPATAAFPRARRNPGPGPGTSARTPTTSRLTTRTSTLRPTLDVGAWASRAFRT